MAEDIFLPGRFTDLTDPKQLYWLTEILIQILSRLNLLDAGAVTLAQLEGAALKQLIISQGAGVAPIYSTSATLSGDMTVEGQFVAGSGAVPITKTDGKVDAAQLEITSQAIGDLLAANSTTSFARLPAVAAGQVLASAGTGTAPAYTDTPTITGATVSGLTGSRVVATDAGKALASLAPSSAYTPTNVTTDRTYDANATSIDELADVLGTLIADLQAANILG